MNRKELLLIFLTNYEAKELTFSHILRPFFITGIAEVVSMNEWKKWPQYFQQRVSIVF